MNVLDVCCGSKMMWGNKNDKRVVFGDIRKEVLVLTDRTIRIEPDTLLDFRALPFATNTFNLVSFDPPHLVRAGSKSWLAAKYGKLSDSWQNDIALGFAECLRVLKPNGVLVFKWNETQVKIGEVINLAPIAPLFGHLSGRKGLTHWLVFIKDGADNDRV